MHQWNLPMHNYIQVLYVSIFGYRSPWATIILGYGLIIRQWVYVIEIVYAPTIFLVKAAILLQYLRLFAPSKSINPFMWYSARSIIVITGIYYTISTFLTIFACSPRDAIWNPLITDSKCLHNNTIVLITCLFNIISDIIILMLPARAVWKLRIPTSNKVKLVLLFAIGLL